jgi:hypothetical protein
MLWRNPSAQRRRAQTTACVLVQIAGVHTAAFGIPFHWSVDTLDHHTALMISAANNSSEASHVSGKVPTNSPCRDSSLSTIIEYQDALLYQVDWL